MRQVLILTLLSKYLLMISCSSNPVGDTKCSSKFIENTCIECIGFKNKLIIKKNNIKDSINCIYYFELKDSEKYTIYGSIWEENDAINCKVGNISTILIPFNIKKGEYFVLNSKPKKIKAKCDDIFFNRKTNSKVFVYKYYKADAIMDDLDADITVFASKEQGILGYFFSYEEKGIEYIISIRGEIYLNDYNYSPFVLGGGRFL